MGVLPLSENPGTGSLAGLEPGLPAFPREASFWIRADSGIAIE